MPPDKFSNMSKQLKMSEMQQVKHPKCNRGFPAKTWISMGADPRIGFSLIIHSFALAIVFHTEYFTISAADFTPPTGIFKR